MSDGPSAEEVFAAARARQDSGDGGGGGGGSGGGGSGGGQPQPPGAGPATIPGGGGDDSQASQPPGAGPATLPDASDDSSGGGGGGAAFGSANSTSTSGDGGGGGGGGAAFGSANSTSTSDPVEDVPTFGADTPEGADQPEAIADQPDASTDTLPGGAPDAGETVTQPDATRPQNIEKRQDVRQLAEFKAEEQLGQNVEPDQIKLLPQGVKNGAQQFEAKLTDQARREIGAERIEGAGLDDVVLDDSGEIQLTDQGKRQVAAETETGVEPGDLRVGDDGEIEFTDRAIETRPARSFGETATKVRRGLIEDARRQQARTQAVEQTEQQVAETLFGPTPVADAAAERLDFQANDEVLVDVKETGDGQLTADARLADDVQRQLTEDLAEGTVERRRGVALDDEDIAVSSDGEGGFEAELSEQGRDAVAIQTTPGAGTPILGGITTTGTRVSREIVDPAADAGADLAGDVIDLGGGGAGGIAAFSPRVQRRQNVRAETELLDSGTVTDLFLGSEQESENPSAAESETERAAQGAGDIARTVPQLPGTLVGAGETTIDAAQFTARNPREAPGAAAGAAFAAGAQAVDQAVENPTRTGGALAGSTLAFGASRLAGPRASIATRATLQPFEEIAGVAGNRLTGAVSTRAAETLFPQNEPLFLSEEAAIRGGRAIVDRAQAGRELLSGDIELDPTPRQRELIEQARPGGAGETIGTGDAELDVDTGTGTSRSPGGGASDIRQEPTNPLTEIEDPAGSDTPTLDDAEADGETTPTPDVEPEQTPAVETETGAADPPLLDQVRDAGDARAFARGEERPGSRPIAVEETPSTVRQFLGDEQARVQLGRGRQRQRPGSGDPDGGTGSEIFDEFRRENRGVESEGRATTDPELAGRSRETELNRRRNIENERSGEIPRVEVETSPLGFGGEFGPDTNVGAEFGLERGVDTRTDLGIETGTEVETELRGELGVGTGTGVGVELGTGAGAETPAQEPPALETETGIEFGTELETELENSEIPRIGRERPGSSNTDDDPPRDDPVEAFGLGDSTFGTGFASADDLL